MYRRITALALCLCATAGTPAVAMPDGAHNRPLSSLTGKYERLYRVVGQKFGKQAPGRDIVRYGIRTKHGVRTATKAEKARSVRTFRRWLAPPIPVAKSSDSISAVAYQAGGRWAIPAPIVMCESGGNYRAVNPSTGAGGAYQILPSTWRAMGGTGNPQDAPPAEQDRIAARVMAVQGRGAWVC